MQRFLFISEGRDNKATPPPHPHNNNNNKSPQISAKEHGPPENEAIHCWKFGYISRYMCIIYSYENFPTKMEN